MPLACFSQNESVREAEAVVDDDEHQRLLPHQLVDTASPPEVEKERSDHNNVGTLPGPKGGEGGGEEV